MIHRIGILGLKGHQSVVLNSIAKMDNARLEAVADDSEDALTQFKGPPSLGAGTKMYRDALELLEKESIDIACVSGTDGERSKVLIECAKKGIHALSEKPLTMTLGELEEVKGAFSSSGPLISMLMTMRFEPSYRKMREAIRTGAIGEVCLANAQKSYKLGRRPTWQQNHKTYSTTIAFIGIHAVDLIRWCTGTDFEEVFAYQSNAGHPEVHEMEDNAVLLLRMNNGGSACVHLDYCRPMSAPTHGDDLLRVVGSSGVIETFEHGSKVRLIAGERGCEELTLGGSADQFLNFVRAIDGEEACEVPAEDCFRLTEIILKAKESALRGQPVRL
jgi:predicted dehydrogenase